MTEVHNFKLTVAEAEIIHDLVKDRIAAQHNWIATAVENGNTDKATAMVKELRDYQMLFATFNMKSKRDTAEFTGKPMPTEHEPRR